MLTYPSPDLESDVVRLRRCTLDDLACVEAAATDLEIPKGTTVPAQYSEEEGRAFVERQWSRNQDGRALALAIARRGSDEAVGNLYLGLTTVARQCRLGYWLVPAARRQRLGSGAVGLISRWVLTETEIYRLVAEVHPANVASIRLLERSGFEREGILRSWLWIDGEPHDAVQFSLVRSDLVEM